MIPETGTGLNLDHLLVQVPTETEAGATDAMNMTISLESVLTTIAQVETLIM